VSGEPIWDRAVGEEVSYLKEALTHSWSVHGLLGSLAAGSLLAIPYGFDVGAIPLVVYGAAVSLAALFVPSSSLFRNWVNRRKRQERMERARAYFLEEIERRAAPDAAPLSRYQRMCERLESLRRVASERGTSLTSSDIERLEVATVDYLGLWLAQLAIRERRESLHGQNLDARLATIDRQLEQATDQVDRRRLEKARSDLATIIERRDRLSAKDASADAAMLTMVDTFEEVYQGVMTNPRSGDISRQLQEAVDRIHIEEELTTALDDGVSEILELDRSSRQGQARTAKQRQKQVNG